MPDDSVTSGAARPSPQRWSAFAVCLAAGFLTLLDVSIVNVALPSIETALRADPSEIQWIVAGYTLAFGLVLVPAGRLGDLFGRRRMFLLGVALFALTSALCGAAPTAELLAVGRVLQGVAAGTLNPQVLALIQELFRGPERGRAFGMFGATVGISTAIGPLLGGGLIALFGAEQGWRAVFWVNVPVGVVVLILGWRLLPKVRPTRNTLGIDVPGLLLLGVSVLAFMLPFLEASEGGAAQPPWWLLGVSVVAGGAFVWWERRYERRGGDPVITRDLLRTPSYTRGALVAMLYFGGFTGIFLLSTLYLQSGLGLEPWQAGLVLTPFALAGAVSSWWSGRWVARAGRRLVIIGIVLMITGVVVADVLVTVMDGQAAAWWLAGVLVISGFGNGIVISPNQALTLADVPVPRAGVAGGALQTGQRVGTSVGVAASASMFFATLAASGDYGEAMSVGLRVVLGVLLVALLIAVVDQRARGQSASSD
ncbi:MFS transporter [Ruania alba]|uniref:Drug resistance transporter, EmrB/QacA subfamily n=1 Tax=Ruania alba TaxID=648782 RepID=A0A1H5KCE3_9MICO|nr:MFS transporter [Ruania alba]SEE62502.1 drug resistance transporter, EmrB/QacA subfamily [Ruania alba]